MGQSGLQVAAMPISRADAIASVFPTALGWMGLVGRSDRVAYLTIGHPDAAEVRRSLSAAGWAATEGDWNPELCEQLQRYAGGEPMSFDGVELELPDLTAFRKHVLETTRRLPYGARITYGELAARAGRPGAARAVGTAMSTNRVPLIIPCHRVIGSGGSLGGYSAPQGLSLKRRLLEMEGAIRLVSSGWVRALGRFRDV